MALTLRQSVRFSRILNHVKCSSTVVATRTFFSKHKEIDVYDTKMSYYDSGKNTGRAIVFLHGNPTSSYLWRNIIPHVEDIGRCLAPDLIGMGRSSKIPGSMYKFQDHYKYLEKWMESVNLPEKVNLVVHDWGSALGFHWANLHPSKVMSITFMEALVSPMPSWDVFPDVARNIFQALRSPEGEKLVLTQNFFVLRLLPGSIMRTLTDEEIEVYVKPFKDEGEGRRPTLTWPREIPIATDGPEDVVQFAKSYNQWLRSSSDIPKLYVHGDPGFFSESIKKEVMSWPNLQTVTVKGLHFLQEDSPDDIGKALHQFLVNKVYA
uniref:Renilla-luciferin 2-monooxygenase-like n=1 Tax=Phallusia mammillata TaxID=59560 RepID=A0A6F9DBE0_9ASCI|nr:renilla-luciferin 2-monooxygenase-like [Phallusia mammillata]